MIKRHHAVHVAGIVLTGAALGAWIATGREGFTRWPDAKLAGADAAPSADENALLAEAGFNDDSGKTASAPDIQSRFAFGLVPSGGDPKHLVSVATAVALAAAASGATLVLRARRRKHEHEHEHEHESHPRHPQGQSR